MDKKDITRESLQSNFLRQTIIRLDYDMLFDRDIKEYVEKIYPYLIDKEYKMNTNTMSNYNVNVNMDELNNITNVNTNTENYFSFKNDIKDITVDITKDVTTLTIEYNKYEKFEDIAEVFNETVKLLAKIRKGFSFNRIGLRKVNMFFIKDIEKINDYLEKDTFSLTNYINDSKINLEIKNIVETFEIQNYKVNKNVTVSKGVFVDENRKEQEAYQIMLDIDIYNDEMKENSANIIDMNKIIFDIYKDSFKYEFLDNLKKENYKDEVILNI